MSAAPNTLAWFARHELRLAWREWLAMMTGGRPVRRAGVIAFLLILVAAMHWLSFVLIAPWVASGAVPDKPTLVMLTGAGLLFWTVMLSQVLESITRVYYARSDLDLILSSPASSRRLFAVRTAAVALTSTALSALLASPLVNVLIALDGPRWLAAYGVAAALGGLATAIALGVTVALFRTVGPGRTRFIAQVVAAIVGAGFVIGVQAVAILHFGSFSRFTLFQSSEVIAAAPDVDSLLWWPARAAMGEPLPALAVIATGLAALVVTVAATSSSYGFHAISTAGLHHVRRQAKPTRRPFRAWSQHQALRRKEWLLLQRDPWLLSQTLMQILYLAPPALLLWLNFGTHTGAFVVVVPVLIMAAGQLAGGLAWLAISGEDAHDLVATAPVTPRAVLRAKIEAVLVVIAVVLAPLIALLALSSPFVALVTAIGAVLSAGSATAIQLWFRVTAKRSLFRRRQVASRAATLSEALASIMWAGTGALAVAGQWVAIAMAVIALLVLAVARLLSPARAAHA
ncbi:permease [Youhaiella tibetensis]|uniref:Permease n=1 Tax=Paradevosia tibetensis TaxID=1447062 RepID=A0A5B9DQD3_9HYPH|nr:permease [Youhaiella tibetensis]QEE21135.1 permease [Youhaiella tibetensis]